MTKSSNTQTIEKIIVPQNYTLEFHFKSGEVKTIQYELTGHKDCWTAEYRKKHGEKLRQYHIRRRETENAKTN